MWGSVLLHMADIAKETPFMENTYNRGLRFKDVSFSECLAACLNI